MRAKGLALTVVVTLALGIGANAAIFSVVRGVLLRPLVNRDEDRLIYIRQSAQGLGQDSVVFSVPEIQDLRARVTTSTAFGEFSRSRFTMVGLGEPRSCGPASSAAPTSRSWACSPCSAACSGRRRRPERRRRRRADAPLLEHHAERRPSVIGKTVRFDERSATIVGVLEPSVPYPAETEIIANVVTSPHHLEATMVTGRVHRMTELFGRLRPGANLESRARSCARCTAR